MPVALLLFNGVGFPENYNMAVYRLVERIFDSKSGGRLE
jgi:hypothetical protein